MPAMRAASRIGVPGRDGDIVAVDLAGDQFLVGADRGYHCLPFAPGGLLAAAVHATGCACLLGIESPRGSDGLGGAVCDESSAGERGHRLARVPSQVQHNARVN